MERKNRQTLRLIVEVSRTIQQRMKTNLITRENKMQKEPEANKTYAKCWLQE
jgi:hypothetical protein